MNYRHLLEMAYWYAKENSDDRSTQNGAILIDHTALPITHGTNRFPVASLADNPANHERPRKYAFTEHAERDVIYRCAREGIKTEGLIMVCPWACCAECARAIALAGITKVIVHKQAHDMSPDRWKQAIVEGREILDAKGVGYMLWDGKIGEVTNLFNGEVWYP